MQEGRQEAAAPTLLDRLSAAVDRYGLAIRGGFHPSAEDLAPEGTETLILIGNVGSEFWPPKDIHTKEADPLNSWTKRALDPIAEDFGAIALYPFGDPPYHPFQRWAQKASDVYPSPLGLIIDPEYGLWHAYRAAFVFPNRVELPPRQARPDPCSVCDDKPCLTTCPVHAFATETGYDVDACARHIRSTQGTDCMTLACRARRACPVGTQFTYQEDFAGFLMTAFDNTRD